MTQDWYTMNAERESGPFTLDEVIQKAQTGDIRPDTLVRTGSHSWTRADKFQFLSQVMPATPLIRKDQGPSSSALARLFRPYVIGALTLMVALFIFVAFRVAGKQDAADDLHKLVAFQVAQKQDAADNPYKLDDFFRIKKGMSFTDVARIFGNEGVDVTDSDAFKESSRQMVELLNKGAEAEETLRRLLQTQTQKDFEEKLGKFPNQPKDLPIYRLVAWNNKNGSCIIVGFCWGKVDDAHHRGLR